jgi:hypothetical protein
MSRNVAATCPTCKGPNPRDVLPLPSSTEYRFRDIVTVCVVDYSSDPITDVNGVAMKYVLVVRDEATKFTVLRPVCGIDSTFLKYELKSVFGLIGYPRQVVQTSSDLLDMQVDVLKDLIKSQQPASVEKSVASHSGDYHKCVRSDF